MVLKNYLYRVGIMPFLIRWTLAFALLAVTYNPTGWSYVTWAQANWETRLPLTLFLGLILLAGYIIYLRATLRSIGLFGILLVLAIAGTLLWVIYDFGWLSLENPAVLTWIGIVVLSIVLAIGLSWSIVRRTISGQADMDDVSE